MEQRFRAALRDFQQWLVNAKISTAKCFDVPQTVTEASTALQRIQVRRIFIISTNRYMEALVKSLFLTGCAQFLHQRFFFLYTKFKLSPNDRFIKIVLLNSRTQKSQKLTQILVFALFFVWAMQSGTFLLISFLQNKHNCFN